MLELPRQCRAKGPTSQGGHIWEPHLPGSLSRVRAGCRSQPLCRLPSLSRHSSGGDTELSVSQDEAPVPLMFPSCAPARLLLCEGPPDLLGQILCPMKAQGSGHRLVPLNSTEPCPGLVLHVSSCSGVLAPAPSLPRLPLPLARPAVSLTVGGLGVLYFIFKEGANPQRRLEDAGGRVAEGGGAERGPSGAPEPPRLEVVAGGSGGRGLRALARGRKDRHRPLRLLPSTLL